MAKSARSKVKRHFRAKKRDEGIYAATEAARLHRLSSKLKSLATTVVQGGEEGGEDMDMPAEGAHGAEDSADGQAPSGDNADGADAMDLDSDAALSSASTSSQRVSTHGPRGSRREQWRLSKGLPGRPKSKSMNRQGGIAAKRKAGRSHRRR